MSSSLEEYRLQVIASLTSNGAWYREQIEEMLGQNITVESVWIHGSVLDRREFREESDIDIAVVIDSHDLPLGVCEELSSELAGELPDGVGGMLDVVVLNGEQPAGRVVPPIRIT